MHARHGDWSYWREIYVNRGSSFMWKEICIHAQDVLGQMSWALDNGQSINLLHYNWLADLPLSHWPMFISTEIEDQAHVSDLL